MKELARLLVRVSKRLGRALGVGAIAIVVLVALLLAVVRVGITLPAGKRLVAREVNRVLAPLFRGSLTITRIGQISFFGVDDVDACVREADGTVVIDGRGVRGRIRTLDLLASIVSRTGPLRVDVLEATISDGEVNLDTDAAGTMRIASAFERNPALPPSSREGREVVLSLRKVTITHALAHGRPPSSPRIDADATDVHGSLFLVSDAVEIDVEGARVNARRMVDGLAAVGDLSGHITVSLGERPLVAHGEFGGSVGRTPVVARVASDGLAVHANLDAPQLDREDVRTLLPEVDLDAPASLRARADGPLSALSMHAALRVGEGEAELEGTLSLAEPFHATADATARRIDLGAFSRSAPRSAITLSATASVETAADGGLAGRFHLELRPSTIGSAVVPSVTLDGKVASEHGANESEFNVRVHGDGVVREVGVPMAVSLDVATRGAVATVKVAATSRALDLRELRRLGPVRGAVSGEGTVSMSATLDLGSSPMAVARLHAQLSNVRYDAVRLRRAQVDVTARNDLRNPDVVAALDGEELEVAGRSFERVQLRVTGRALQPRVKLSLGGGEATLDADARLDFASGVSARDVNARLSRGQTTVAVRAKSVIVRGDALSITDATLERAGEPLAFTLQRAAGETSLDAASAGVDLKALAYVLGEEGAVKGGRLAVVTALRARRGVLDGTVEMKLTAGSFATLPVADGEIHARLSGRRATGDVVASFGELGRLRVTDADVTLAGNDPFALDSWRYAWGAFAFDGSAELQRLALLVRPGKLSGLGGRLVATGRLERDAAGGAPGVTLSAKTVGLAFDEAASSERGRPPTGSAARAVLPEVISLVAAERSWHSPSEDLELDVKLEPRTGALAVVARLVDPNGLVATLDARSAKIPYGRLFDRETSAATLLASTPFEATATVPRRRLDRLPSALQLGGMSGEADATLHVTGTALEPVVEGSAHLFGVRHASMETDWNGRVTGRYQAGKGSVTLDGAGGHDGTVTGALQFDADLRDAWASGVPFPSAASARISLSHLPLGTFSAASNRQIVGSVSGEISVVDFRKNARATAALRFEDLRVAGSAFTLGTLDATVNEDSVALHARFEQADGYVRGDVRLRTRWGAQLWPSTSGADAIDGTVEAKHLRVAWLLPFLTPAVSDLDGYVDGEVGVALARGRSPQMHGSAVLTEGVLRLESLGGELHGVGAKVTLTPDGVLRVRDVTASGTTGTITANATVRLDGLSPLSADATVGIPRARPIALNVQGTSVGALYGDATLRAAVSSDRLHVQVDVLVPHLNLALPLASSHTAYELNSPSRVHVGVFRDREHFALLPMAGGDLARVETLSRHTSTSIDVAIHLGDDIQIKRGTQVKVALGGDARVHVADRTTVAGQIHLRSGQLQLQGKTFEIEKGTISFVGDDAGNPQVSATAGWTASDGTRVYAEFLGPLRTGKVTLRSEPARSNDEIVALLVFGSADGSSATPYANAQANDATRASVMAGGLATEGLNSGLNRLTGLDIATRIDTTNSSAPRPGVEVQIAKDISLQIAFVLGTPPPGTNPDTTYATIDWRFMKNWSIATTFGDLGSSIAELLWHYRY